MELEKAVSQLAEIHAQIAKTELYRGFRATSVSVTAASAALGALAQPYWVEDAAPAAFVGFWVFIALVNSLFTAAFLGHRYLYREGDWQRRQTRHMLGQFGPALLGGALLAAVGWRAAELVPYLPGLWSLVFALGVFAARPYLPANIVWAGRYYLAAAVLLLFLGESGLSLHPWGMGLGFGLGQALVAAIMYRDLERHAR